MNNKQKAFSCVKESCESIFANYVILHEKVKYEVITITKDADGKEVSRNTEKKECTNMIPYLPQDCVKKFLQALSFASYHLVGAPLVLAQRILQKSCYWVDPAIVDVRRTEELVCKTKELLAELSRNSIRPAYYIE